MAAERKLVYVLWEDITQTDSSWRDLEEALDWSNSEVSLVHQVGFLLDKDENYITLICSYLPPDLAGTVIRIPVSTVKYVKEFTVEQVRNL
jgi:hypothetical protein